MLLLLPLLLLPFAVAQEDYNTIQSELSTHIGIVLSDSCHTLNALGEWTCPRHTQFLHLDTSQYGVSGSLVWNGIDIFREPSPFTVYSYEYYDFYPNMTFVDPPTPFNEIAIITVLPSLPYYSFSLNNTVMVAHSVYVDPHCRNAEISAGAAFDPTKFEGLIKYMREKCTSDYMTQYISVKDLGEPTEWDPLTSPHYIYRLWIEEQKERCKYKC